MSQDKMEKLVIKLGGSVLFDQQGLLKTGLVEKLRDVITKLMEEYIVLLVVGGGAASRSLVQQMQQQIANQSYLDHLSILTTRLHAQTVRGMLMQHLPTRFLDSYQQLYDVDQQGMLYLMGGLVPGQSTNGAAAMAAEAIGASRIFNLFNYDYIMSQDPETSGSGEILREISYEQMEKLISGFAQQPGHYELFDQQALRLVSRSGIEVVFLHGDEPGKMIGWEVESGIGSLLKD